MTTNAEDAKDVNDHADGGYRQLWVVVRRTAWRDAFGGFCRPHERAQALKALKAKVSCRFRNGPKLSIPQACRKDRAASGAIRVSAGVL